MAPATDGTIARQFAERFIQGSVADAVDMLSPAGRTAVVEAFPSAFREDTMDASAALEASRRGLSDRYGDPQGVGAVRASDLAAPVFVAKTGRSDEETGAEVAAWLREQAETWRAVDLPPGTTVAFNETRTSPSRKGSRRPTS